MLEAGWRGAEVECGDFGRGLALSWVMEDYTSKIYLQNVFEEAQVYGILGWLEIRERRATGESRAFQGGLQRVRGIN
jgi:hypothetical protein